MSSLSHANISTVILTPQPFGTRHLLFSTTLIWWMALGSDFKKWMDMPFCGRPRKPRPLITVSTLWYLHQHCAHRADCHRRLWQNFVVSLTAIGTVTNVSNTSSLRPPLLWWTLDDESYWDFPCWQHFFIIPFMPNWSLAFRSKHLSFCVHYTANIHLDHTFHSLLNIVLRCVTEAVSSTLFSLFFFMMIPIQMTSICPSFGKDDTLFVTECTNHHWECARLSCTSHWLECWI